MSNPNTTNGVPVPVPTLAEAEARYETAMVAQDAANRPAAQGGLSVNSPELRTISLESEAAEAALDRARMRATPAERAASKSRTDAAYDARRAARRAAKAAAQ